MDAWDRAEARYLRGLRVQGDVRLQGLVNAILYGWGAIAWWTLAPVVGVWGWHRQVLWASSWVLVYLSLRSLAVIVASSRWLARLALARRVRPGRHGAGRADRLRLPLSPLSRVRVRRTAKLWNGEP